MKCCFILIAVTMISVAIGSPLDESNAVILRQKRDIEIYGNTKKLIEELVQNLRNAAKQAIDAMNTFTVGIKEQIVLFREKVELNIALLRERVRQSIENIANKLVNASSAVRECIELQRQNASALMNETLIKTTACADNQIERISGLMNELANMSDAATNGANNALVEMHNCTDVHEGHFFALGTCLGNVVVQSEIKGAVFGAQSGLMMARINLAMATLPAALEMCAGARLVEAGARTAQLVMEVGRCSVSSAFSVLVGNNN